MLEEVFEEVYDKFKLNFYRNIFCGFAERESSLTATETFCVEVIYALNEPTINEMANFLNISQPNMTYKVNNLVKKGYVEKIQSDTDKREVYLKVTDKFMHYYEIKNEYMDLVIKRIKDRFSKEDLNKFEEVLNIISKELMHEITEKMNSTEK